MILHGDEGEGETGTHYIIHARVSECTASDLNDFAPSRDNSGSPVMPGRCHGLSVHGAFSPRTVEYQSEILT